MASMRPIVRLKADIATKGIRFFDEIDQQQLGAGANLPIGRSTLLLFGNPPLGVQFLQSNPLAGLDWPVRMLVTEDDRRRSLAQLDRLPLHRRPLPAHRPRPPDRNGERSLRLDRFSRKETAMISATPLIGKPTADLPRRDLVALFQYLNRKELEGKSVKEQLELADGVLRKLAAASRLQ